MNNKISTKARRVFVDLAIAVANALAHPACPRELANVLSEAVNPLADLIAPSTSNAISVAMLRGLANRGIGKARPGAETFVVANPGAKSEAQKGAKQ
jgi:hypothetical protein